MEGQEPVKAEHTAAEVSEGDISLPEKAEKPSVLGKLAAAKLDAKESGQPVRQGEKYQSEKNRRMAESYRQSYPPGTRLELIGMDDPFAPIPAGMRGTVNYVDDQSQIHVKWDNGSGLALIPDTDSFRRLSAKEIEAENAAKGSVVSRLTASKTQPGKEREEGRRQAKPNKKKEDMQL